MRAGRWRARPWSRSQPASASIQLRFSEYSSARLRLTVPHCGAFLPPHIAAIARTGGEGVQAAFTGGPHPQQGEGFPAEVRIKRGNESAGNEALMWRQARALSHRDFSGTRPTTQCRGDCPARCRNIRRASASPIGWRLSLPKNRLNPGNQLIEVERLDDEIRGARL